MKNELIRFVKHQQKAEGILAAIMLVIALMLATIIVAAVFFPFSTATTTAVTVNQSFTRTGVHRVAFAGVLSQVKENAGTGSALLVHAYNSTSGKYGKSLPYNYTAANNSIVVPSSQLGSGDTKIIVNFYGQGYSEIGNVQTLAITVFALLAIVPLILVGALMLRSLGFMGGGKEV
jgi:hypothetical protein